MPCTILTSTNTWIQPQAAHRQLVKHKVTGGDVGFGCAAAFAVGVGPNGHFGNAADDVGPQHRRRAQVVERGRRAQRERYEFTVYIQAAGT